MAETIGGFGTPFDSCYESEHESSRLEKWDILLPIDCDSLEEGCQGVNR